MKKTFLLIAKDNSYGLVKEAMVIAEQLEAHGYKVERATPKSRSMISRLTRKKHADVIIFFERIFPAWYSAADEFYLVPNQERYPKRQLNRLKKLNAVLTKTRHAEEVFQACGSATIDIGFSSEDRLDKSTKKDKTKFFHLAGGSTLKGTEVILKLWEKHPEWPTLTLVQKKINAPEKVPTNVELHSGYLSNADLLKQQNECGIHLCPSRSEGWGHYIVEALSTGAVVLTTDAEPMNEHIKKEYGVLVPYDHKSPRHIGTNFYIDEVKLEAAINALIQMDETEFSMKSENARLAYEGIHKNYVTRFEHFLKLHGHQS